MDYANDKEKLIVFISALGGVGLFLETMFLGWENWLLPLIIIALVGQAVIFVTDIPEIRMRIVIYLIIAMTGLFIRGVHSPNIYWTAISFAIILLSFSFFNRVYVINLILIEYIGLQMYLYLKPGGGMDVGITMTEISQIIFMFLFLGIEYFFCNILIEERIEIIRKETEDRERVEDNDRDMEDFLSNISHELRTPVNVVQGMSDLLIKRNVGYEADAIKNAGIRLAGHIEDIQDYTECKRDSVILEEDEYMGLSLINDVVTTYRMLDKNEDLEFIVNYDPALPLKLYGDIKKLHKIFRHLIENAVKFTKRGGIYVKLYAQEKDYGVNLCLEVSDTGIGMDRRSILAVSDGLYQGNKKRNRSSGGIGLGLFIVYGFAHKMGGFVKIESEKGSGTTVRVTVPQIVRDASPGLSLDTSANAGMILYRNVESFDVPRLREMYMDVFSTFLKSIRIPYMMASTVEQSEAVRKKTGINTFFVFEEDYLSNKEYFDKLASEKAAVAVFVGKDFKTENNSRVLFIQKPLYSYAIIRVLNGGFRPEEEKDGYLTKNKPDFSGVKALIVDDEPMNLVVATGIFRDYDMTIETAGSGSEAIRKYREDDYDIIFMDHMMPEMDGIEAMKYIRAEADKAGRSVIIVALTANAVSGAREMFIKEGFDGFIAKPINTDDFERVMLRVLPNSKKTEGGETR
ncbi:MAG: response regulator [Lachnospiraceae bacterium]|nr:response regulator [Lachnospiraceae bacterium]